MKRILSSHTSIRTALIAIGLVAGLGIGTTCFATGDSSISKTASNVGTTIDDTAITAKVKAKLMGEEGLGKSDISVTTADGVVTLDGVVSSLHAKSVAESAARSVDGVQRVSDNLEVPTGAGTPVKHGAVAKTERAVSDSWITTKVKSRILSDSVSKGFDVSVMTTHGVVTLKGSLASQHAIDHVRNIARSVKGVRHVNTGELFVAGK
ncbi:MULTISPECIES: BON domain-containing protein [Burkholderia]|uniref:Hyperosmotically inducible protein n=1 Tax=Burkholderia pyrrocinia TaxID=60550 RepID=A0A318IPH7_BURPY|nr:MULTISPECIES: BON domain-containing protein [Burkholderia]PXX33830.1 hyperosmotically inducible protein [Burkholderia pyrrocinia]SFW64407.1 hyperosmotically inducible protein [Burkholderia sp. NFACC33-1]SFY22716.1 hyperosmotically inducible protein [Burkholderia sp. NFPP32]